MGGSSLTLNGIWRLSDTKGDYECPMSLPGDGITGLYQAGLIADPYWGRNEYDLRWISERDWVISREIDLDRTDWFLEAQGLDTVVRVLWNGTEVLSAQNAFRRYRMDLRDIAKTGVNTIELHFRSAVDAGAEAQAALPFCVPHHAECSPIPNGNMLRKVQCDFGWDWNIALAPFGVTGDLTLVQAQAPRFGDLHVTQAHRDGAVTVSVDVPVGGATEATATFCDQIQTAKVQNGSAHFSFDVINPELWWPNGFGPANLHPICVTAGTTTLHRKIGLRQIELLTTPDAAGSRFALRINGTEIFAKGANWIPADALAGRITETKTRALLQSAADAHMNMIRVWGGGRYEPDSFYSACDELGLLVWQDFMFSCNLYPSTPDFLTEVHAEVVDVVGRLQHHASIALWCGDNELVGALGWFPQSRADRDRYLVNYDRTNRTIEQALLATDPAAIWWPSSPCPGVLNFGDSWHDDGAGDMHFWSVWHEGKDFDHYRDVKPRFCSEFGFQSYPSLPVIETFTTPSDRNIAAPVLESHQKNAGGNARIAETMFRYFRWPERFADFVWLSQVQQGLAIKTAVTQWRGLKPHCMGTLYWQLNDTWPVCSWASLDYGGGWKLLHYMARDFYAPVTVVAMPDGDDIVLRAVNDLAHPVNLTVTARAVDMSGTSRALEVSDICVGKNAQAVMRLPKADLTRNEILHFAWVDDDGIFGHDHFAPEPYKSYDLRDPCLSLTVSGDELTITSENPAFFVTAEADQPGRFSANAVFVLPGQPTRLKFSPDCPEKPAQFTLRDLYSATCAQA